MSSSVTSPSVAWLMAGMAAIGFGPAQATYAWLEHRSDVVRLSLLDAAVVVLLLQAVPVVLLWAWFRWHERSARPAAAFLVAFSAAVTLRQIDILWPNLGSSRLLVFGVSCALLMAVIVAVRRLRVENRRLMAGLLAWMSATLALWFLVTVPTRSSVEASPKGTSSGPVFLLVLDELSLEALELEEGKIDAQRFPRFARFLEESSWWRRARSVSSMTAASIPVLLNGDLAAARLAVGRFDVSKLPKPNLLDDLAVSRFSVSVHSMFLGCTGSSVRCLDSYRLDSPEGWLQLAAGMASTYLPHRPLLLLAPGVLAAPHRSQADWLATDLSRVSAAGDAVFVHSLISHYPWVLAPSGEAKHSLDAYFRPERDPSAVLVAYRDQLQFADAVFGRFLESVRAKFSSPVVVLTSDHGTCWTPACNGREAVREIAPALYRVPMAIWGPAIKRRTIDQPFDHTHYRALIRDVAVQGDPAIEAWLAQPPRRTATVFYHAGREFQLPD